MNPRTQFGAMPAKLFVKIRPIVMAGLAKLVELVKTRRSANKHRERDAIS
jgi:hypothetical protein